MKKRGQQYSGSGLGSDSGSGLDSGSGVDGHLGTEPNIFTFRASDVSLIQVY